MTQRLIAVFDIDGVLADASHRQHFVESRPKDWDAFFAAVGEDPVIDEGRDLLLATAHEREIVIVSGRPERTREATTAWLEAAGMGGHRLVLRPDVDRRRAADLKSDLLRDLAPPAEVALVVDDDLSVVERLSGLGYRAVQFPMGDPLA